MSQFSTQRRGYVERTVALLSQRDGVDKVCGFGGLPVAGIEQAGGQDHAANGKTPKPNPADPLTLLTTLLLA
jgi:hypothetical protein